MHTIAKRLSLLIIGAVLAANVSAGEAFKDFREVTVSYGDLNLSHAQGVARLYRRLKHAAEKVCVVGNERDLQNRARRESCVDQAISRAVDSVNEPELSRYYSARKAKSTLPKA